MLIDCETHVLEYIDMPQWGKRYQRTRVEHLLEDMDRTGVDKTFLIFYDLPMISPCASLPDPTLKMFGANAEEYFLESWQEHKDRFFMFHSTDPRQPDCIEHLEHWHKRGLQGLGETEPVMQGILPNGPEFHKVYRFAAERSLPVIVTMEFWDQFDNYWPSGDFDTWFGMYESVIREYRDVRFMLGHGGNCGSIVSAERFPPSGPTKDFSRCARTIEQYLEANMRCYKLAAEVDNLWICSCMPWWFQDNEVSPLLHGQLEFLRKHVGFSKVSWGSDWPWNGSSVDFCFNSDYNTVVDAYRTFTDCTSEELDYLLGRSAYEFVTGNRR